MQGQRIIVAAFLTAAIFAAAVELYFAWPAPELQTINETVIGGPFSMTDNRGRAVTEKDFEGKANAFFFGFTSCPDICPTTLNRMSGLLDRLGDDAGKLNVILVSVDAERDTPEILASYLQSFDARITGITGTEAQIRDFARKYRVFYEKVPDSSGSYTMNHTSGVLLFDDKGAFRSMLDGHEPEETALKKLQLVISG